MALPKLDIRFLNQDAINDLGAIQSLDKDLLAAALAAIESIARQEVEGKLLEKRTTPGDLSDCRKLYFDVAKNMGRPGWRIVFRFKPSDANRVQVQLIVIARRAELEAYEKAVDRLQRRQKRR